NKKYIYCCLHPSSSLPLLFYALGSNSNNEERSTSLFMTDLRSKTLSSFLKIRV
ncbi:hypothetical protein NC651_034035, partial [Populus alba x Populus x berolinensis]